METPQQAPTRRGFLASLGGAAALLSGCATGQPRLITSNTGPQSSAFAQVEKSADGPVYKVPPAKGPAVAAEPAVPPKLKWPPPRPSARHIYPDAFMARFAGKTCGQLLAAMEDHVLDRGYPNDMRYFSIPEGYALVLPYEVTDRYAVPWEHNRFIIDPLPRLPAGNDILRPSSDVRLRRFVLYLTNDRATSENAPKSFSKQRKYLGSGAKSLDSSLAAVALTPSHQLRAYAYWYSVAKVGEPRFIQRSLVYGIDHLRRASIVTGI